MNRREVTAIALLGGGGFSMLISLFFVTTGFSIGLAILIVSGACYLYGAFLGVTHDSPPRQKKVDKRRKALEAERQKKFDKFYWNGILIDPANHDKLYAEFKFTYDPGEPVSDDVRYRMLKELGEDVPDSVVRLLCDDAGYYMIWPDMSKTHDWAEKYERKWNAGII